MMRFAWSPRADAKQVLHIARRFVTLPRIHLQTQHCVAPGSEGVVTTMRMSRQFSLAMTSTENTWEPTMISEDDATLVERARRDSREFAPLYLRYRQAIFAYCDRRLGTPDLADDATSIVFINALNALDRYRPDRAATGSTFRSWLFTIAHNVVVDHWRRHRHQISLDSTEPTVFVNRFSDQKPSPEAMAIDAEGDQSVASLLARLPERQRTAVELRLAGLSTREIAHSLGMTVSAAKSVQFRAYRTLRDLLRFEPDHSENEAR